jgi:hypothetical protein
MDSIVKSVRFFSINVRISLDTLCITEAVAQYKRQYEVTFLRIGIEMFMNIFIGISVKLTVIVNLLYQSNQPEEGK